MVSFYHSPSEAEGLVCVSCGQEIPPCPADSPEQWVAETGEPHNVRGTEDRGQLYQAGEELDGNNPE